MARGGARPSPPPHCCPAHSVAPLHLSLRRGSVHPHPLHLVPWSVLGLGGWLFWLRGRASLPPRGGGRPPLFTTAGRPLRADIRLRKVGASAVRALRHGVLAPVTLLGPASLNRTPVFLRLVSLRAPATPRGCPGALRLDVASLATVATSNIRSCLLVGLDFVAAALKPQCSFANEPEDVLVCHRQNHRRRPDDSLWRALALGAPLNQRTVEGTLAPSFPPRAPSGASVPFDPLPRYRATGTA